jgi:D-beta-D-heptose 7-phosphate kinase/D-beta-D-heptose 1-phosphate adenosyltransferase
MADAASLVDLVRRFDSVRLLCVGDVILDRFVYGEAERLSPEAPVPVLKVTREEVMLGGAGNVARNLAALDAGVTFVSVVGNDEIGREVQKLCGAIRRARADFVIDSSRATSRKTRYVAGVQQLLRADEEVATAIAESVARNLINEARHAVEGCDAVIVSDYGKGALTPAVLEAVIAAGRGAGKPVLVDPKGRDFGRYRGATMVTPNRRELAEASGLPTGTDAEIEAAARKLLKSCGIDQMLATRGAQGMSLVTAEEAHHVPAESREVFDVSGAGDTVIAVAAGALALGAAATDAMRLANLAAGIVVGKAGTAVADPVEITAVLQRQELMSAEAKLVDAERLADRVAQWRAQGLRVGFTNGCFDLLHPGHVSLFAQARAACDRLVVGLNTDASVARLKGPGRPVQSEAARAAVLGSLASIDLVVLFDEDTPITLIEAIRPDLLVKGADYTLDKVVGGDFVQSYGGRVLLAKLLDGHSTTSTLERMAR